jgi:phosphopantothenoylcysteine decarboxylase/phosphopantothenate--cysteine ligase
VLAALPGCDAYIGAAAVADYTPVAPQTQKIKKSAEALTLALTRTADVLAEVASHAQRPRCVVGFAAETGDVENYAREKLVRKKLDLIAANDVSRPGCGFESERNALTVFTPNGRHDIAEADKATVARALLELIADHLQARA